MLKGKADWIRILRRLQKIAYVDDVGVRIAAVQPLVDELEGEPCTEEFINDLGDELRRLLLGVVCTCGEPGCLNWHKNSGKKRKGAKLVHFTPEGRHRTDHFLGRTLPRLKIVKSPLRKWRRSRRQMRQPVKSAEPSSRVCWVLAKLKKIKERSAKRLERAQKLLARVEGKPCTKELIGGLMLELHRLKLRVSCSQCGEAAALQWVVPSGNRPNFAACVHPRDSNKKRKRHRIGATLPSFTLLHCTANAARSSQALMTRLHPPEGKIRKGLESKS
jgi:hypothetical protein